MRVLICVESSDGGWTAKSDVAGFSTRYLLRGALATKRGDVPMVDQKLHPVEAARGLMSRGSDAIFATYEMLLSRSFAPDDPEQFGQYLFDCLIGSGNWTAIRAAADGVGAWVVEIALRWECNDVSLSRLPWELVHNWNEHLASGYARGGFHVDVAITRVVPRSNAVPRAVEGAPRVLFAVGTTMTDLSVRPAVEIIGLLNRVHAKKVKMHQRAVERVSPSRLRDAVLAFRPHVVHIICHGGLQDGAPYLRLQPDTTGGEERFQPAAIADALQASGEAPPLVVLSACQSATAMLGPRELGPFAAQLVERGIPVVIGMSGKVSDIACRLFTRRFAESLLAADRLTQATAEGRRAAFISGASPTGSIDWAFPAVYLSEGVSPNYQPTTQASLLDPVEQRIRAYDLRDAPVFCGRNNFFEAFETLFMPGGRSVLAVYASEGTPGLGRKRLLEELTIQAILDHNVPVLVTSRTWQEANSPPITPLQLALEIDRAIRVACTAHDVKLSAFGPIKALQSLKENPADLSVKRELTAEIEAALIGWKDDIPAEAALLAIQSRLGDLVLQIRASAKMKSDKAAAELAAAPGDVQTQAHAVRCQVAYGEALKARAVVLLDSIQLFDTALDEVILRRIGAAGFGTPREPVPLVVTFSLKSEADTIMSDAAQNQPAFPHWRFIPLKSFALDGEWKLAYSRVLMNPFDANLKPSISDKSWYLDDLADAEVQTLILNYFDAEFTRLPANFCDPRFYLVALFARDRAFLKEATDVQFIAAVEQERLGRGGNGP